MEADSLKSIYYSSWIAINVDERGVLFVQLVHTTVVYVDIKLPVSPH